MSAKACELAPEQKLFHADDPWPGAAPSHRSVSPPIAMDSVEATTGTGA